MREKLCRSICFGGCMTNIGFKDQARVEIYICIHRFCSLFDFYLQI